MKRDPLVHEITQISPLRGSGTPQETSSSRALLAHICQALSHKHWWATTAFLAQFSYPVAGWERHPEANPKPVVKLSSGCLADAEGTGASSSPAQTCTHRPMGTWRQQLVLHSSKPCSWHCQPLDTPKAAPRIHQLWQRWSTGWEMRATPRCCEVTGSEVK